MSIDLNSVNQRPSASEPKADVQGKGNSPRSETTTDRGANTASSHPVEVSISAEARSVDQLTQSLGDLPEIDADKVAAIRQAIADGQYPIDADRLASNFIRLEQDL